MATAMNCTVKVYKGVPLIKGGTEVLYLSQGAAEGVLGAFLAGTYSQYYYTRENRGAIQVDDMIQNLEGCNYVSFQNNSHGGKLYFGFIDQLVYINDNTTEIRFTVDPFPTYYESQYEKEDVYTVRNTPKITARSMFYNFTPDYVLPSIKYTFQNLGQTVYTANRAVVYFASQNIPGDGSIGLTGIKMGYITGALLNDIQQNGGVLIGAYAVENSWVGHSFDIVGPLPDIAVGNPFVGISSNYTKLKTGLYAKLALTANSEVKYYDIEEFSDPENISFGQVRMFFPGPSVFVYPHNYKGRTNNLAEGILCKFPALPITANAVYTNQQRLSEITQIGTGAVTGGIAGAKMGGLVGAAGGAIAGALMPALKGMYTEYIGNRFVPPTVIGHGEPVVDVNKNLTIGFNTIQPDDLSISYTEDYFDQYGYAINAVMNKSRLNLDDKSYLQTGEEFILGSEADPEINARIMSGIRIRKTLA